MHDLLPEYIHSELNLLVITWAASAMLALGLDVASDGLAVWEEGLRSLTHGHTDASPNQVGHTGSTGPDEQHAQAPQNRVLAGKEAEC